MVGDIHARQLFNIIFFLIFPTALLYLPSFSVGAALQGVWISILIASIGGIFLSFLLLSIYKRNPDKNLLKIIESVFGKYIGKTIGILLALSIFHITGVVIREFGLFLKTTILLQTPLPVLLFIIVFVSACMVRSGLEVIARMADFMIPIVLMSLLIILILLIPSVKLLQLTPFLEAGWGGILKGSLPPLTWFSEIYVVSLLFPFVKQRSQLNKAVYGSMFLIGFLLLIATLFTISVFGIHMTARVKFPLFEAASLAHSFFLEQLDVFLVSIWIIGVFMKTAICFFATIYSLGQVAEVKSYKSLVLPIGLLHFLKGERQYEKGQTHPLFSHPISGNRLLGFKRI